MECRVHRLDVTSVNGWCLLLLVAMKGYLRTGLGSHHGRTPSFAAPSTVPSSLSMPLPG